MSEHTENVVPAEEFEITDESIQDFLGGDAPSFHPILQVWREVLRPAAAQLGEKITPQWAQRITSSYSELTFADMPEYSERYFNKIIELSAIVDDQIETDDECLNVATPEEDVENNSKHYKRILADWQLMMLGWELAWDCTDEHAAVELAAISEVHKMFFGPTGLTAFLDNIKFEFTEADQAALVAELEALKEGR